MTKSLPGSLSRLVRFVRNQWRTMTVYPTSGAMGSGIVGPGLTAVRSVSGINYRFRGMRPSHPGCAGLEGMLRRRQADAGAAREGPKQCMCANTWGFHDITLVDMAGVTGPPVSKEEIINLRRQWPTSLVLGMSRRQTDLELLRRECKSRFRSSQTGRCTYCGRSILHDMARHVSNYHLDLTQCPLS